MGIGNNYLHILQEIAEIARLSGRKPSEVHLVAVSKGHSWKDVEPAFIEGCLDFGENRIQEALPKMEAAPASIRWHMIGTLQKNKVRKVLSRFHLIHSVDSFDLAKKIAEVGSEIGVVTPILLEVHLSGETTKHGLVPDEWLRVFDEVMQLPNIQVKGLMTMAPFVEDEFVIRNCFAQLRKFRDILNRKIGRGGSLLTELSMGMSHDFRWAIQEGATLVRIGTAIFGERQERI
jgi:hypothetical protein